MKRTKIKKSQKDDDNNKGSATATALSSAKEDTAWANRPVFSGFLGGNVFVTKKGFRGMKMDPLWVKHLMEAFKNDDIELAQISFESTLSDVNDVVIGGENGCPYSIGDFGFYAEEQFEAQYKHVLATTKQWCLRNKHYLSGSEWEVLERKLSLLAHHGEASFYDTCRGDSFACLAVRYSAFQVAKFLLSLGLDPLLQNERQQDLFLITKVQYGVLTLRLKDIQVMKKEAVRTVLVPSVVASIINEESSLIQQFKDMSAFVDEIRANFRLRMQAIEMDKMFLRQCELTNEEFPVQKSWNISQLPKLERYLPEMDELQKFIDEKVKFNEIEAQKFRNLSDLLMDNYSLIETGPSRENGAGDGIIVSGADGADGADGDSSSIASSNQLPSIEPSRSRCHQMEDQQAGHGDSSDGVGHHRHSHRLSPLPSINNSSTPAAVSMSISSSSSSNGSVKTPPTGHGTITRSSSKLSCSSSKPDFQRTPTLKNVDDLFDMLGISDSDSTRSMKNNNNSSSKASKLLALSTREQYAPTQGVLKESETETIMYR